MTRPLFSVVTVTLNAGDDLLSTVKSLNNQNMDSYEHIVKDGGSSDNSLISLPSDSRRRVIVKPDIGIYEAMNQSLDYCEGQYVVFLNAGDCFYDCNVLETVAINAKDAGYPNIIYTDIHNNRIGWLFRYPSKLSRSFLYRKSICHQATYIKRTCYSSYGRFDLEFKIIADNEYLLRLLSKGETACHCPIIGIKYKDCGFSALSENATSLAEETDKIRRRYFSRSERFWYGLAWFFTFPRLRVWILNQSNLNALWIPYTKLANLWNRNTH